MARTDFFFNSILNNERGDERQFANDFKAHSENSNIRSNENIVIISNLKKKIKHTRIIIQWEIWFLLILNTLDCEH